MKMQVIDAEMVRWSTLLALKARAEIAESRRDEALNTIATGLAFNHHIGAGPFLMHPLVAIAGDQLMFDRIDELITLPDAPNLYWALTALPQPLVNFRAAMENESRLIERLVPELTEIRLARREADWSSLLAKINTRMDEIRKMMGITMSGKGAGEASSADLDRLKSELLPEARKYAANLPKADQVASAPMSDDQMIVLYIAGWYRQRWDDLFKASYLPYPEARPFYAAASARRRSEDTNHPLSLLSGLAPAVAKFHEQDAELDRRVAALRAVEAVRLDAAANGGRMPESLGAVKIVPIPPDTVTGKPFQYTRDGATATLVREGPPPARLKVIYRIVPQGN